LTSNNPETHKKAMRREKKAGREGGSNWRYHKAALEEIKRRKKEAEK
jgi:hypothetical protein